MARLVAHRHLSAAFLNSTGGQHMLTSDVVSADVRPKQFKMADLAAVHGFTGITVASLQAIAPLQAAAQ